MLVDGVDAKQALLGHTDFHYRADTPAAYSHDEDESQLIILYDEVAFLHVFLSGRDPLPLLDALYPAFQDLCRQERRTAVTWWEYSLQERGFVLDQVEVTNTQQLSVTVGEGDVDKRYELVTWTGETPDNLLDGMARLRARMTTDAPNGSRETEEAAWYAARIRREEVARSARRTRLWAVALDPVGEPAGYTMLESLDGQPEVALQMDTLVRREDRGHGPGLALKRANLTHLQELRLQARCLHTWNAGEYRWMLDINRPLGFTPTSALGAWQRTLTAAAQP